MPAVLLPKRLSLLSWALDFRLLFAATLGSGFGTYLAAIALTVDVYDRTGSGTWVAALLIVDFLPMIAVGLLLGPFVDRFSRRGLMIGSDLPESVETEFGKVIGLKIGEEERRAILYGTAARVFHAEDV